MKLSSVFLKNFRCFGSVGQTVTFDPQLSALIGSNGAGKSALLVALSRVFGLSASDRTLERDDFHLSAGKSWDAVEEIKMVIELKFEFPELGGNDEKNKASAALFKHLTVSDGEKTPHCTARLAATWTPSPSLDGSIDSEVNWVLGDGEKTAPMSAAQRALISVHYIPATRDPIKHIRRSAGSILYGFMRAINWTDTTKTAVSVASESIRKAISSETGMATVNSLIEGCWQQLHKEDTHKKIALQPVSKQIEEVIKQVDAVFSPTTGTEEQGADKLSDGQRSLFYIALVAMSFDVQDKLESTKNHGLDEDKIKLPVLTILAVEEPENHVSPHYLGRIIRLLNRIGKSVTGQVVLTSHSPAIMARVEPEGVRHLIRNSGTKHTNIREISLPNKKTEQSKYVRQAVRSHPELYFSKLVILGEGDSEEIVIPRIVRAFSGEDLDTNLISFVPLGGRHVNHFWKLLNDLGIPHLTLLDLDLGRKGGDWSRIKYVILQLMALGHDLKVLGGDALSRKQVDDLHKLRAVDLDKDLSGWASYFEAYQVFFSSPLDIDLGMLEAFPNAYKTLEVGEQGPNKDPQDDVIAAVLGEKSPSQNFYKSRDVSDLLRWYRYLFLGRGKPSTHSIALQKIEDEELKNKCPDVLRRLAEQIVKVLEA